eukprot:1140246-Pelagomonas_calceolata.AAC.2
MPQTSDDLNSFAWCQSKKISLCRGYQSTIPRLLEAPVKIESWHDKLQVQHSRKAVRVMESCNGEQKYAMINDGQGTAWAAIEEAAVCQGWHFTLRARNHSAFEVALMNSSLLES